MFLELIWLIPLIPLFSFVLIFFFGKYFPKNGAVVGISAIGVCLVWSIYLFLGVWNEKIVLPYEIRFNWFKFGIYTAELGMLVDGLTIIMLLVVSCVSFFVQVYSLGYMKNDPRFKRYFSYLSLFSSAMLGVVVANNFLQLFICWELVGLCSYLLIGFWFERESPAYAGRKAFITTKVGDIGFFLAILLIFSLTGTLNIPQLKIHIENEFLTKQVATIIAILLFCGAVGKSAQFPLHVWLPDAMEGPTPVSALIHAATMVAAGVFMVARLFFIYQYSGVALEVVAWIGIISSILAATMALVSIDIKRILAFSTVSQLGYMMFGLGVGGNSAGMFHLTTHAFFKALLFLCAGAVIHSTYTNDIRKMGGVSKSMPVTFLTFTIGALAISGIWPFAGFYSKDAILKFTIESGHKTIFLLGLFVTFLTSFYMFRLLFLVFTGTTRDSEVYKHLHEAPKIMTFPLIILAFLSLVAGYVGEEKHLFEKFVPPAIKFESHYDFFVPILASLVSGTGILFSWWIYVKNIISPQQLVKKFNVIYNILFNKYWIDEFYISFIVKPIYKISEFFGDFDYNLIDQKLVDGFGVVGEKISIIKGWVDDNIVDKIVNFFGYLSIFLGKISRKIQTGFVQNYLYLIIFTAAVIGIFFVM